MITFIIVEVRGARRGAAMIKVIIIIIVVGARP